MTPYGFMIFTGWLCCLSDVHRMNNNPLGWANAAGGSYSGIITHYGRAAAPIMRSTA